MRFETYLIWKKMDFISGIQGILCFWSLMIFQLKGRWHCRENSNTRDSREYIIQCDFDNILEFFLRLLIHFDNYPASISLELTVIGVLFWYVIVLIVQLLVLLRVLCLDVKFIWKLRVAPSNSFFCEALARSQENLTELHKLKLW